MKHTLLAKVASMGTMLGVTWYLLRRRRKRRIVITGACGNLGSKLAAHLSQLEAYRVVGVEHPNFVSLEHASSYDEFYVADVAVPGGGWRSAMRGADCIVHFSAVNPYPNATWAESAASMRHAFNVMTHATRCGVRRVVVASSNHVMGGYKDDGDSLIVPADPPRCGTMLLDAAARAKSGDAVAYAGAKLAAEQLAHALAPQWRRTSFLVLRIGWCQPGANLPATLTAVGVPPQFQTASSSAEAPSTIDSDEAWFRNMWLSNADFLAYCTAAIDARLPPGQAVVLNAMSANSGARWSLGDTARILGVRSHCDVWASP